MKGAGSIMNGIIILVVLFFFVYLFIFMTSNASQRRLMLNLDTAEFMKAKNSVYLLDQSLQTTWFTSSVQLLFKAGYESVGCGYDDIFEDVNLMQQGYWYQYRDPALPRVISMPVSGEKYNHQRDSGGFVRARAPSICLPDESSMTAFLQKFSPAYLMIPSEVEMNGHTIKISQQQIQFAPQDHQLLATAGHTLTLTTPRISIVAPFSQVHAIQNEFKAMLQAGRSIVLGAIADAQQSETRLSPWIYYGSDTIDAYRLRVAAHLITNARDAIPAASQSRIAATAQPVVTVTAARGTETGLGFQQPVQGLVVHYQNDVTITQISSGVPASGSISCVPPPGVFGQYITDAVAANGPWRFTADGGDEANVAGAAFDYTDQEIIFLVQAIIQKESAWDPAAQSSQGAVGLMQLMPGTAQDMGLSVPPNADDRLDPQKNIAGGVKYLRWLFGQFAQSGISKDNLQKLVLAGYNAGPGNLRSYIFCSQQQAGGTSDWNDIVARNCVSGSNGPNIETLNYVGLVQSCFVIYSGGVSPAATMQWPTASRRITDCFGVRTMSGELDQHNGIDIGLAGSPDVLAAAAGTVQQIMNSCDPGDTECGGRLGNYVFINHENGMQSRYGHLTKGSVLVNPGDVVQAGQIIGSMGSTGDSTGVHLHFALWQNQFTDPCSSIDCTQSNGLVCTGSPSPSVVQGLYYYHDESANTFTPRPFSLTVKTEDYWNALDCVKDLANDPTTTRDDDIYRPYGWNHLGDMVCCGGGLWTCDVSSDQFPTIGSHGLVSGQKIDGIDASGTLCANTFSDNYVGSNPDPSVQPHVLGCQGGQFTIVPR